MISADTYYLDSYVITSAARAIEEFVVEDLSQWYIRRSRQRFQAPRNKNEKREAAETLYLVLLNLIKLIDQMTPFLTEKIYLNLKSKNMSESIHLCDWPKVRPKLINKKLEEKMVQVRNIVALALQKRNESKIKVRQPLRKLKIKNEKLKKDKELLELIKNEINVKEIVFDIKIKGEIELDVKITPELKEEGIIRDVVRQIQEMRKKSGLRPHQAVVAFAFGSANVNAALKNSQEVISRVARLKELLIQEKTEGVFDAEKSLEIGEEKVWLAIKKIR